MGIETIVIVYVLGLLAEVLLSVCKIKALSAVPVIVSCVAFLITKEENCYLLAVYQVIVCFVALIAEKMIREIVRKKRNSEIDRSKIKDLE